MTLLSIPAVTNTQRRILQALFDEGGLSTALIAQYILPGLSRNQAVNTLRRLRALGLIASRPIGAAGTEEHCWYLRYDGSRALGRAVLHTEARYRVPTISQLDHKALTLRLVATLHSLNWEFIRPAIYNSVHPKPDATPQQQALHRAVAAHFQRTTPADAVARLHPSHVPPGVNDWVAWPARQPEKTAVFIVHPVGGTRHFWQTRERMQKGRANQDRTPARTHLYADVAAILPVIGLFATRELVHDYAPILRPARIRAYTLDDLPVFLHNHSIRPLK
jgi:hypothetical protein